MAKGEFDKPCELYGEDRCYLCRAPASHKVEEMHHSYIRRVPEVIVEEYARLGFTYRRHPLTNYLCCGHFKRLMGPASPCEQPVAAHSGQEGESG